MGIILIASILSCQKPLETSSPHLQVTCSYLVTPASAYLSSSATAAIVELKSLSAPALHESCQVDETVFIDDPWRRHYPAPVPADRNTCLRKTSEIKACTSAQNQPTKLPNQGQVPVNPFNKPR